MDSLVHALIFAGGAGRRMHTSGMPKQFLRVFGKPILIHTLEKFDMHEEVDDIVLVSGADYLDMTRGLIRQFGVRKVTHLVPGGETGQESIWQGLQALEADAQSTPDDVVLIHDGVRPLIGHDLISQNIDTVRRHGSAISAAPATETFCTCDGEGAVTDILPRPVCRLAKAPQSFHLKDICEAHRWARQQHVTDAIDSADLMRRHGASLHWVDCPVTNIKITHPVDYYIFKGILNAQESEQILGL